MNRRAGLVVLLLAALAARVDAAPSCAAQCVRRMAECRATRCAGLSPRRCHDQCRAVTGCAAGGARIGTLGSVVTECRSGPAVGGWTLRQRLEVRRGDCAPVILKEVESSVPVPDRFGLCAQSGVARASLDQVLAGVFTRIEVSPDGKWIVYELTDDDVFRPVGPPPFSLEEEGIFVVRADGTEARLLGPASRQPKCTVTAGGTPPPGFPEGSPGLDIRCDAGFEFSPNGELIVFTDRGPGTDGSDAVQLVTLNVRTGERRQVTRFVAASQIDDPTGPVAFFVDNDTIRGLTSPSSSSLFGPTSRSILFTVRKDGSDFRTVPLPTISSGSRLVPVFGITGRPGAALVFTALFPGGAQEIVVKDHRNLLQVTNFGRPDTHALALSPAGKRIFFQASADPFGRNPQRVCQIFSVDHFGGDLRELTDFRPGARDLAGCSSPGVLPPSCTTFVTFLDTKANTLVFYSSCDPFGTNPVGAQWFAVRTDGSGLRQVTNYRGMQVAPDGTVSVELPLPTDYAERIF